MSEMNPELTPRVASVIQAIFTSNKISWAEDAQENDEIVHAIESHGLAPIVFQHINKSGCVDQWPSMLIEKLSGVAKQEVATELAGDHELKKVLVSMNESSIHPILIKGTPLSYTLYPERGLRPRCDTDMLIAHGDRRKIAELMTSLGYKPYFDVSDSAVGSQTTFIKTGVGGVSHTFDIHRSINDNSQRFSDKLSYEALLSDAQEIPALGDNARTLQDVDALLLACLHRAGHYSHGGEHLIWLYDIHLLAEKLTEVEFQCFVDTAMELKIAAVSIDALQVARNWFGTKYPDSVIPALERQAKDEPSKRFLEPGRLAGIKNHAISDLGELPSFGSKLKYLFAKAFPPVGYMVWRYEIKHIFLLPVFYLYRLIYGLYVFLRV